MKKCLIHSLVSDSYISLFIMLFTCKPNQYTANTMQSILYKINFSSIVSISSLMRSLGWLKFRYICKHRLSCITHKAIHRGFHEYLAQSIIIQN